MAHLKKDIWPPTLESTFHGVGDLSDTLRASLAKFVSVTF